MTTYRVRGLLVIEAEDIGFVDVDADDDELEEFEVKVDRVLVARNEEHAIERAGDLAVDDWHLAHSNYDDMGNFWDWVEVDKAPEDVAMLEISAPTLPGLEVEVRPPTQISALRPTVHIHLERAS